MKTKTLYLNLYLWKITNRLAIFSYLKKQYLLEK